MARLVPRTVGAIVSVVAATLLYGFNWPLDNAGRRSPPDGRRIHYLRLGQAGLGGWMVDRTTNVLT